MGIVYIGGARISGTPNITTRSLSSDDGAEIWNSDHGQRVNSVASDNDGNVYIGGNRSSSLTTRKYNSSGTEQWNADHGDSVFGIAVDSNGNVYTAGSRTSSITTRKYNSSGTEQWNADHGAVAYCISVDSNGNVYTGGFLTSSITTRKYNSSGIEQWNANHGNSVFGIAVDSNGNVYTAGNRTSNLTLRKYNNSGNLLYSADTGDTCYSISLDEKNGFIYAVGGSSSHYIRKFNISDLSEVTSGNWPITGGNTKNSVAMDFEGNIYTAGARISSKTTYKYDSTGTLQWSVDHGNTVYGLALYIPPIIIAPSLSIDISLGIPFSTFVSFSPELSIQLNLGIPVSISSLPPDPSAILVPVQTIYRLYITGGDWLELPMHSFQCRRRLDASTWVTVVVDYSTATRAALDARLAGGGRLSIFSGVRYSDGTESSGEFLQAALTRIDDDRQFRRGILTVTGRVIPVAFSATSRTLRGVSMRGMKTNGRRLCECDVDPLLRPNDTVDDGVETWTVGAIDYQISPAFATMLVEESV